MHHFQTLKTEMQASGILTIILNRPERLNALNQTVLEELQQLIQESRQSEKIKALLITGEGKAFCAGADINRLLELNAQQGLQFATQGQQVLRELEQLGKPSLAAINGYALGGGCELAMATTLRIGSHHAQFAQPEIKLGVIPGYGGTQRLARLIGKGRALDLCLTGRIIKAEEALAFGLISEITAPENLLIRATEILENLLKMAPIAAKSIMKVIDVGLDLSLEDALHLEAVHFAVCCATQDKKAGVEAFLQKRAAVFKGE